MPIELYACSIPVAQQIHYSRHALYHMSQVNVAMIPVVSGFQRDPDGCDHFENLKLAPHRSMEPVGADRFCNPYIKQGVLIRGMECCKMACPIRRRLIVDIYSVGADKTNLKALKFIDSGDSEITTEN